MPRIHIVELSSDCKTIDGTPAWTCQRIDDAEEWLQEMVNQGVIQAWYSQAFTYYFYRESDAIAFKLQWC